MKVALASAFVFLSSLVNLALGSEKYCKNNRIALTFDDGPYTFTKEVVDMLVQHKHYATFFVNVNNYDCYYKPDYVKAIRYALYHNMTIENHSQSHAHMDKLNEQQINEQIHGVELYTRRVLGLIPKYFRQPYGNTSPLVDSILQKKGLTSVLWSIDGDNADTDVGTLLQQFHALNKNSNDIILLHDVRNRTVKEILPQVMKILSDKGIRSQGMAKCLGSNNRLDAYKFYDPSTRERRTPQWNCDGIKVGDP